MCVCRDCYVLVVFVSSSIYHHDENSVRLEQVDEVREEGVVLRGRGGSELQTQGGGDHIEPKGMC